jgi:hypothetical protein
VQSAGRLVKISSSHYLSSPATNPLGNSKAGPAMSGAQPCSRVFAASHAFAYFGVAFCGNELLLAISLVVNR